jgi:type IV pilus assembly protein PilV
MLVEVLVALLVFALGVLTIVGLQAAAVQRSAQAQHRATATLLANDLIGRMWVTDRRYTTLSTRFTNGGVDYKRWLDKVEQALPGAAARPPTVQVDEVVGDPQQPPSSRVTIRVHWESQLPEGPTEHQITVVTRIGGGSAR